MRRGVEPRKASRGPMSIPGLSIPGPWRSEGPRPRRFANSSGWPESQGFGRRIRDARRRSEHPAEHHPVPHREEHLLDPWIALHLVVEGDDAVVARVLGIEHRPALEGVVGEDHSA